MNCPNRLSLCVSHFALKIDLSDKRLTIEIFFLLNTKRARNLLSCHPLTYSIMIKTGLTLPKLSYPKNKIEESFLIEKDLIK